MNPLTNVKNINKLNEIELAKGYVNKKSWHDDYKDSAWIFIGGLAYGLTEGDILAVFSQYGEIVNVNLVRDKKTGKTKGFCFLCYANQKSTVLAVDNLNGIKLCNRTIRVDHVANYKPPKENEHDDEITKQLKEEGCAPKLIKVEPQPDDNAAGNVKKVKKKKVKKEKKKHKKSKKSENKEKKQKRMKVKKEKHDPGYDKYEHSSTHQERSKRKKRAKESESSSDDEPSSTESDSPSENVRGHERSNFEGNSSKDSRVLGSCITTKYKSDHPSTSFNNSSRQNDTFVSQTIKIETFKENIEDVCTSKRKSDHESKRRRHNSFSEEEDSALQCSYQSNDRKHYSKSDQSHDRYHSASEDKHHNDFNSYSQDKSVHSRENERQQHRKSTYRDDNRQSESYSRKRPHSGESYKEQHNKSSYKHTETYSHDKRSHSKDKYNEQHHNSDHRDDYRRKK